VLVRPVPSSRPISPADWLSWIPLAAALAATQAVRTIVALPLSLKWPNDLLLDTRKVGGILCESGGIGTADSFVVIGLGLNVNAPRESFPPDLQPIVASLRERTDKPVDRNRLLARWLLELEQLLDLLATDGPQHLHAPYSALCATVGRQVKVRLGRGQELIGIARGIGQDGALHLLPDPDDRSHSPQRIVEIRAADVIHLRE
jgi:BirA family biotin operon repressor/biotin-[acetyl-CoA-carboxylase] ligase